DLVRDESSTENLSILFQVSVGSGDLKRAIFPARQLIASKQTPPEVLVSVANVIRIEDQNLAVKALEAAVARDLNDPSLVAQATMLAAQLERDSLTRHLVPKMIKAARRPDSGVREVNLPEAIELQRAYNEQAIHALNQWRAGTIAIHSLPRAVNAPLASWL